jgi:hypothetical protein
LFHPVIQPTTEVFPKSKDRDEPSAVQDWRTVKSSTALFPIVFGELSVNGKSLKKSLGLK